jgi:hypothetical protein
MAEYHWTWEYTIRQPIIRQLAWYTARRLRKGEELGGNDYRLEEFIEYQIEVGDNGK